MISKEYSINLLEKYMSTPRLSGYESKIAGIFKEEMDKYCQNVKIDNLANVIATFEGTDKNAPALMIIAHMDTIGFVISKIDSRGFIYLERVGGVSEKVIQATKVLVMSEDGKYYPGIIGSKAYHTQTEQMKSVVDPLPTLFVDIGAKSREEVNSLHIYEGCAVTYAPSFMRLLGDRIAGAYIDDAVGLTNLAQVASVLKDNPPACTVHLVGSTFEEFNARGAQLAARTAKTDIAICLLSPGAGDTPDQKDYNEITIGGGPATTVYNFHGKGTLNGIIAHKGLLALCDRSAREIGVNLNRQAGRGALSDTAYLQLEGDGIPCIDMGTPDRYSHSPIETIDYNDMEAVSRLLLKIISNIDASFNISRF